jgi:hypothetical protein
MSRYQLFGDLYHEVRPATDALWPVSLAMAMDDPTMALNQETVALARALGNSFPHPYPNLRSDWKVIEKVPVYQVMRAMEELPRKSFSVSLTSSLPDEAQLWNIQYSFIDSFVQKLYNRQETYTRAYWDMLWPRLDVFGNREGVPQLKVCNFVIGETTIQIGMEWSVPCVNLHFFTIPDISKEFWTLQAETNLPSYVELNTTSSFLDLQIASTWGNQELIAKDIQDGRFIAYIQTPRADVVTSPPDDQPLWETSQTIASDYMLRQYFPVYERISRKLEANLSAEIERYTEYVRQGAIEPKYVDDLRRYQETFVYCREAYQAFLVDNEIP